LSFILDKLVPKHLRKNFIRLGRSLCLNHTRGGGVRGGSCLRERVFENVEKWSEQ